MCNLLSPFLSLFSHERKWESYPHETHLRYLFLCWGRRGRNSFLLSLVKSAEGIDVVVLLFPFLVERNQ